MGMSTHVIGFAPPDESWEKMRDVYLSCQRAGVEIPEAVQSFFDYQAPDPAGVQVAIPKQDFFDDGSTGIEIDVKDIPAHVTKIRFFNSW